MILFGLFFIFIQQITSTSIGGELNAVSYTVSVQTPAEIEELRLKSSHPVKTPE